MPEKPPENLEALRTRIEELDGRIVDLINKRAMLAGEIGSIKRAKDDTATGQPIYVPSREREVYQRVLAANQGPMPDRAIRAIYREIMSGSIAIERPTRVSYLGPEGTHTQLAVRGRFGTSVESVPQRTIGDVFLAVGRDHADYGLVPIENSTEGGVNQTQDCLMRDTAVRIYSEVLQPIHHHLMAASRDSLPLKAIYSHPQVFGQCRDWLSANLPEAPLVETASTTAAAQRAADEPGAAAIASAAAADIYGLMVIESNIEDQPDNMTRFLVLSKSENVRTGDDKTTIFFSIKDRVGALAEIINVFSRLGVNMSWIQSRPSKRKPWDYIFWADLTGHYRDENVAAALTEARELCHQLEVCGSFPAGRFEAAP